MVLELILLVLFSLAACIHQECDFGPVSLQSNDLPTTSGRCPENSQCFPDKKCKCIQGFIGNCKQKALPLSIQTEVETFINDRNYTFIQIIGPTDQDAKLFVTFCQKDKTQLLTVVDIWEDDGEIDVFEQKKDKSNRRVIHLSEGCIRLVTDVFNFKRNQNGETLGVILGLKTKSPGNFKVSLAVQFFTLQFWQLMGQLALIIGGSIIITIAIAVSYVTYQMRKNSRHLRKKQEGVASCLEQSLPAFKLRSKEQKAHRKDLCSVCLVELGSAYIRQTVCKHMFHRECLDQWCQNRFNCPICRHPIRKGGAKSFQADTTISNTILRETLLI